MKGFISIVAMSLALLISNINISKCGEVNLEINFKYEEVIEKRNENILVIFGTEWCGSCIKLKNDLDSLNLDNYTICIVDVEEREDLGKKYSISSYPTSLIIKNKEVISKKVGYKKEDYTKWLSKNRELKTERRN